MTDAVSPKGPALAASGVLERYRDGPGDVALAPPRFAPRPRWHAFAEAVIHVFAMSAIAAIVLIIVFVAREALPLFTSSEIQREVDMARMWFRQTWPDYVGASYAWQPVSEIPKYSVVPLLFGTLKVTVIAVGIAAPLGIASALFVAFFASHRVREIVKPLVELLAGIPSVVLGFFALIVLATHVQDWLGLDTRLNALVAGAALSLAVIPIIFTISEEAFGAVPKSYLEASVALGARRYQSILRVVLPAAAPGLVAGLALGFGRAAGETMIVLMASGNAPIISERFDDSVRTLSATIAAELAEVVFGGAHYSVLFFLGALLFGVTFIVNAIGGWATQRLRIRLGERS